MNLIFFNSQSPKRINDLQFSSGSLSHLISVIRRFVTRSGILIKGPDMLMLYERVKSSGFNLGNKTEHVRKWQV